MSCSLLRQFVLLIGLFALSFSALGQKSMLIGSLIGVQAAHAASEVEPQMIAVSVAAASKMGGGVLCMSVSCLMCQAERSAFSAAAPGTILAMQFGNMPGKVPAEPLPRAPFHPPRA